LKKQDPAQTGRTYITDLKGDPIVMWQDRNYLLLLLFATFFLPAAVCGIGWGDWRGGFVYAAILRMLCVQQPHSV
jgi:stearoyl-CoA desaturase (delta-9 desaturase)